MKYLTTGIPSEIIGDNVGVCGLGAVSYSVAAMPLTSYNWSFSSPDGAVVSGQGTSNITAAFGSAFEYVDIVGEPGLL